jgi:hypothetical protein
MLKENDTELFNRFLSTVETNIPLSELAINFSLSILLSLILRITYTRCGTSFSNRNQLASTFIMFTLSTTLIISVVKSSLALSLGLVGALSVIRFRTAIKEPEELMYLFFCIAIGIGLGANQSVTVLFGSIVILIVIWIIHLFKRKEVSKALKLTIAFHGNNKPSFDDIIILLRELCSFVDLRRFDETDEYFESTFNIIFTNDKNMSEFRQRLSSFGKGISVTFFDDKGLLSS